MNISTSQAQGNVPVTIIKLDGQLDGQNYQELITKAQELYSAGARDFLLDLSDLTYISSGWWLYVVWLCWRAERNANLKMDGLPLAHRTLREAGPRNYQITQPAS
jgi:hypothetical protein